VFWSFRLKKGGHLFWCLLSKPNPNLFFSIINFYPKTIIFLVQKPKQIGIATIHFLGPSFYPLPRAFSQKCAFFSAENAPFLLLKTFFPFSSEGDGPLKRMN
jgi:hypothetical protein